MNSPFFSIVICAFNKEKYINKCILSALGQSFKDFELIILDDFSDDNTAQIIKNHEDVRINFIQMPQNKGVSHLRNHALSIASGEYILFVDADDWLHLNVLECAKKELLANAIDVLFVPYCVYWQNKNRYKYNNPKYELKKLKKYHKPYNYENIGVDLFSANYEVCTKFYKKDFLDYCKIYFKDMSFAEDFVFYFDVMTHAKSFSHLDDVGYFYRMGYKNYDADFISCQFEIALSESYKLVLGSQYEDIFFKKCAQMLNFWIVKLNFNQKLHKFACEFCKNRKIININSSLECALYKIYFKIVK